VIEIKDLQKVIEDQTVVDITSLSVNPGEVAAIVGQVGSRKGVVFQLLSSQIRPTAGIVRFSGFDPFNEREEFSRHVGILFSEDNLYTRHSPRGNLNFYRRLYRLPPERVDEVLTEVGLLDHADMKVNELPSNLVRRTSFGRSILHKPAALILDEPFDRCDQSSVTIISNLIRQYSLDGVTILILAHDDDNLNSVCDVIYRLEQGRMVDSYYPADEERKSMPFMIPAKLKHTVALVDPADILFVFAQDDRAYLQTDEGKLRTQFTMGELEKRLSRSGFFRAHRGYLVNLQHVKEVIPYTRDSYNLRLKDSEGTKIPLSKSAARELRDILGY
jgi:ABC-2 type transport system ATP-binding protein